MFLCNLELTNGYEEYTGVKNEVCTNFMACCIWQAQLYHFMGHTHTLV